MHPQTQNLVLGDGQVETTAAIVLQGALSIAGRYNLTFANSGSSSETLVLTYSRNGGTQRLIRTVTLETDEVFEITGLPVNKADAVYAATTNASVVDYVTSVAAMESPLTSQAYDATGAPKSSPQMLEQLAIVLG